MNSAASRYDRIARETFLPQIGKIVEIADMTAKDRFFRVELEKPLGHRPGQFVMVSILGLGEAPISISNGPTQDNILEMVIRRIGRLTQAIHELKAGDQLEDGGLPAAGRTQQANRLLSMNLEGDPSQKRLPFIAFGDLAQFQHLELRRPRET